MDKQNLNASNPDQREEILKSLFDHPYLRGIVRRIYKQTTTIQAVPKSGQAPPAGKASGPTPTTGKIAPATGKPASATGKAAPAKPPTSESPRVATSKIQAPPRTASESSRLAAAKMQTPPPPTSESPRVATSTMQEPPQPATDPNPPSRKVVTMSATDSLENLFDQWDSPTAPETQGEAVVEPPPSTTSHAAAEMATMMTTLSQKMAQAPADEFADLVNQLQSTIHLTSSLQEGAELPEMQFEPMPLGAVAEDIQEFADHLGVNSESLNEAMQQSNIPSLQHLYQMFTQEMTSPSSMFQMADFDVFVKCFVQSYLDEKNEEMLLGLIGVSASTGKQKLNTAYAKLLTEIFKPEVGGFFLRKTDNANYNCFNVGNVVQAQLIELDEDERVAYLEKLLALLRQKDALIPKSRAMINASVIKTYFLSMLPDCDELLPKLEQYLADLAIFRLGFVKYLRVPNNIVELLPKDIYECLSCVTGFPANIAQKPNKVMFMLRRLGDNNPLLFRAP